MKLRNVVEALGLRARPIAYGYHVTGVELERDGVVQIAQWDHPKVVDFRPGQSDIDELRRFIRPGDAIVDVGAHMGDSSLAFALATGPSGRVFAVEPNRYVLPVLRANASLNTDKAAPIEIFPYAATETAQLLEFSYSDPGYCNGGDMERLGFFRRGHYYPLAVEGRNIAAEIEASHAEWIDRIRLIKSDTEGNHLSVLRSFEAIIKRVRPYLMLEIYKRSPASERRRLIDYVETLGYQVYRLDSFADLTAEKISADDAERWDHYDIFCLP